MNDQSVQLDGYEVTAAEAEAAILDYLRDFSGQPISMWRVINTLCSHPSRSENRRERKFYLHQLKRLVHERKVIQYWRSTNLKQHGPRSGDFHSPRVRVDLHGKIRISEAYV